MMKSRETMGWKWLSHDRRVMIGRAHQVPPIVDLEGTWWRDRGYQPADMMPSPDRLELMSRTCRRVDGLTRPVLRSTIMTSGARLWSFSASVAATCL